MFGLLCVPYEVLANIVDNIDFDDVFNLALVCKELKFLVMEESICKNIVQTKIKFSNEALAAMSAGGGNARALRRAAKRRNALAAVNPFTVATIGVCDAFVYLKGVLCYTLDDKIRILDLHDSEDHELVISIPGLLTQALCDIQSNNRGTFQILYYSDRIISCLYRTSGPDPTAWLIAFNVRYKAILLAEELESTEKIFVRHNREFLYFGTNSDVGTDGHKKWVIRGYSFRDRKWFEQKIPLPDMVGNEIGSTICFEIHKKHFYALSNQTSFEVEEIDWTSFYHCVRFPLDSPCRELLEKTNNDHMWRRQHQEGPIDDRWTFLRLDTDETTGDLKIVESRKEWYLGASRSQRTYYTTEIKFPELKRDDDLDYSLPGDSASTSAAFPSSDDTFDNSLLPDDPIVRLRMKDDNPHYLEAPPRNPHYTHPGNDGSTQPTYTLAKTLIRTYHTSSSTFLDLVDDPLPSDWRNTQRLRLRGSSRQLGPPLTDAAGLYREPSDDLGTALTELYTEQPISFFPSSSSEYEELYSLMNPPTHQGNVHGVMDDRSMVYVTGAADKPQALIFVGFDAGVRLRGVKRWGMKGVGEGPHIDGRATGCNVNDGMSVAGDGSLHTTDGADGDAEEKERTVGIDRKGKGKVFDREGTFVQVSEQSIVDVNAGITDTGSATTTSKAGRWAWKEKAMYRDIGLGYNFGLAAKE